MNLRGSSDWKSKTFWTERQDHFNVVSTRNAVDTAFVKRDNGDWILFGPQDVRSRNRKWHFALQRLACDKQLRVVVGCRYYTLAQAWNHWHRPRRLLYGGATERRNECKQAIAIIQLMILQAQAYGLLSIYKRIVFDGSLIRKRR